MDGVNPLLPWQHLLCGRPGRTTRPGPLWHSVLALLESTRPSRDGGVAATCLFLYLIYVVITFTTGRIFAARRRLGPFRIVLFLLHCCLPQFYPPPSPLLLPHYAAH